MELNDYQKLVLMAASNIVDLHKEGSIKVDYKIEIEGEELMLTPILYIAGKRRVSTLIRVTKEDIFGRDADIVNTIKDEVKNIGSRSLDSVLY